MPNTKRFNFPSKLIAFDAILIEAIFSLVLFIVLTNSRPIVAFNTVENTALTIVWNRPTAHVYETITPNSECISDTLSCTIYSQWPGQKVTYVVDTETGTPAQIYSGTVYADSTGKAKPTWEWSYAVAAFPNSYANCYTAGSTLCKTASISNSGATMTQTFGNLLADTDYKVVLCAPNCGTGTTINSWVLKTGVPARLSPAKVAADCNSTGSVHVDLSWTGATPTGLYDRQYLDLSLYDNNFSDPNTVNAKLLDVSTISYSADDFAPSATYYWRVNNRRASTDGWVTSATATFTTPACTPPPAKALECQAVDYNHDGGVNAADLGIIRSKYGAASSTSIYDLNHDGVINDADLNLAATKVGQVCYPHDYAVGLTAQIPKCTALASGDVVNEAFGWYVASGNSYDLQYLNVSFTNTFAPGTYSPNAWRVDVGKGSFSYDFFAPATTYYWRINTRRTDGIWNSSVVRSFTTPPTCVGLKKVPAYPNAIPQVTETVPGTKIACTSNSSYSVTFNWINSGYGWFIDISPEQSGFPTGAYFNKNVDYLTTLTSDGTDFGMPGVNPSPTLTFTPGKIYYWRMYYGTPSTWSYPAKTSFSVPSCSDPTLIGNPQGWPIDSGQMSQGPNGAYSHSGLQAIDAWGGGVGVAQKLYATLTGTVTTAGYIGGEGTIVIQSASGRKVKYLHQSVVSVAEGQTVRAGDLIGMTGSTGAAAVHSHYEFIDGKVMGSPDIPTPLRSINQCINETACNTQWQDRFSYHEYKGSI